MLRPGRFTFESAFYTLAFLLALFVRCVLLGSPVLSDSEAVWGVQALDLANGMDVNLGPQPGYILLTSFLFSILGTTNFIARLLPALAGSLLVVLPVFFRRSLGRYAALVFAFGLALDPGLVSVSRTAGGPVPALSFVLLAVGAAFSGRAVLAGIFAGLALLSGPAFWYGIVGLGIAWGLGRWLETKNKVSPILPQNTNQSGVKTFFLPALYWLVGTLVVVGTLFFQVPQGLGAMAGSLPSYLNGWTQPSGIALSRMLIALLVYQPLVVLFASAGVIRSWVRGNDRYEFGRWLSLWAGVALLLALLYPSRQISDLVWLLVPLWGLAGLEISHHLFVVDRPVFRLVSTSQAAFIFILIVFMGMNLTGLANPVVSDWENGLRNIAIVVLGVISMGLLTTLLISLGWSWDTARSGLVWGTGLALFGYMLAGLTGGVRQGSNSVYELWSDGPAVGQVGQLVRTLQDLSFGNEGHYREMEVAVMVDTPSMRWTLRDWKGARFVSGLMPGEMPPAIISYQEQENPTLAASYRGQSFVWEEYPAWRAMRASEWVHWWAFRSPPRDTRQVILWVRADLFPGGSLESLLDNELLPEDELDRPELAPSD